MKEIIKADKYYIDNLNKIMKIGCLDENPRPKYRDGTPAYTKFITGVFEEYDISKGEFPIPTLRNTAVKTGIKEILWIYQKQSNSLEDARNMGINWWNDWDIGNNSIGQRYGATVKKWNLIDDLLKTLTDDPFSRRHIMNMYQYSDLQETKGLFPCAYETIWSVEKKGNDYILDMTLIQRSCDFLVAKFINQAQYVALQMMVAGHLGYKIGNFRHLIQNLHIYDRHNDAVDELLNRTPINKQPTIELIANKNFYDYKIEDFKIKNIEGIIKIKSDLDLGI